MSIFSIVLDFVFPEFCLLCDTKGFFICKDCKKTKFQYYQQQKCHVCKKSVAGGFVHQKCRTLTMLDGVVVLVHYTDTAKKVLEELKYKFYFSIAKDIGRMMSTGFKAHKLKRDIHIPVPLSRKRKWWRGFNQSELLAGYLGDCDSNALKRTKHTRAQVGLVRSDRLENVSSVFEVAQNVAGKTILLIDDVMTTGATLEECAKILKKAGAKSVHGFVWARD